MTFSSNQTLTEMRTWHISLAGKSGCFLRLMKFLDSFADNLKSERLKTLEKSQFVQESAGIALLSLYLYFVQLILH